MTEDAPPGARLARVRRAGGRGVAAAPPDRLDRPLPVPPPGRDHADRGDARRAGRARGRGQGALRRLVQPRRPGRSTRPTTSRRTAAGALRQRAERVQLPRARRRGGAAPAGRAARDRCAAVLPARERAAHRQVPPRRAGACGDAARAPARAAAPTRRSTGSRRSSRSPSRGGSRSSTSPSAGSPRSRRSRR